MIMYKRRQERDVRGIYPSSLPRQRHATLTNNNKNWIPLSLEFLNVQEVKLRTGVLIYISREDVLSSVQFGTFPESGPKFQIASISMWISP